MKLRTFIALVSMLILLVGCGQSKDDIRTQVKESVQTTLDEDPDYREYGMVVKSIDLVRETESKYKAIANITFAGKAYPVSLEVFTDGDEMLWETEPMAFGFLVQHELENLFPAASTANPEGRWSVHVGSFQVGSNSLQLVQQLKRDGFPAFETKEGNTSNVFVGPMESRPDAMAMSDRLIEKARIRGQLVPYPST